MAQGPGSQEGVFHRLPCSEKASEVSVTSQLSGQGGGILGKVYLFFFLNKRTLILLLITKQYLLSIKKKKNKKKNQLYFHHSKIITVHIWFLFPAFSLSIFTYPCLFNFNWIRVDLQCCVCFSKVIQLYIYLYSFFSRFFSHVSYHRILSRVPCAIQ